MFFIKISKKLIIILLDINFALFLVRLIIKIYLSKFLLNKKIVFVMFYFKIKYWEHFIKNL